VNEEALANWGAVVPRERERERVSMKSELHARIKGVEIKTGK